MSEQLMMIIIVAVSPLLLLGYAFYGAYRKQTRGTFEFDTLLMAGLTVWPLTLACLIILLLGQVVWWGVNKLMALVLRLVT